jgi:uncharacterized protein
MQYPIFRKLIRPGSRVEVEVEAPVPAGVGADFSGPVTGSVELTNAGSVVTARGMLFATLVQDCSRCLIQHTVPLQLAVNEECRLAQIDEPMVGSAGEAPPIPILDGGMIDLTELVRQIVVLNLPTRSLCRPDCQGLCPQCGENLNCGPCHCPPAGDDPRWAALSALLPRDERTD